ncbi:MAG: arylesterase [Bacteroidetes bacterium]|nr:MAG: arylesterase [Bacteroidota bacterium]
MTDQTKRKGILINTLIVLLSFISFQSQAQTQSQVQTQAKAHTQARPHAQGHGEPIRILFFGDSITAGYEIGTDAAFPALIDAKLDSLPGNYTVVNAGLSGETSAGGLRRVDWILRQPVDLFVLELGGNDGLRGIDPEETKRNLQGIIDKVQSTSPGTEILLTGMEAPPNMGQEYTKQFRSLYRELAEKNDLPFMPFILEGVAGDPSLNLPDGIHPTEEGHRIIAKQLWPYISPIIDRMSVR